MQSFANAAELYSAALEADPENLNALQNLAYLYMLRRDFEKSRELLQKARRLYPENEYVKKNLEMLEQAEKEEQTKSPDS